MLPQKFSAATTRTVPEPGSPFATAPQPASRTHAAMIASHRTPPPYYKVRLSLITVMSLRGASLGGRWRTTDWSEHVHAVLSQAGLKRGGARERVIELLATKPCALSAVEIEDELRASGRPTGRASVYRVLDLLVEHGLVERARGRRRAGAVRAKPSRRRAPPPSRVRPLRAVGGVRRSGARAGDRSPVRASRRADRQPRRAAARRLSALRLKVGYQASTFGRRLPGRVHHSPGWSCSSVAIQRRLSTGSITSSISPYAAMLIPWPRS